MRTRGNIATTSTEPPVAAQTPEFLRNGLEWCIAMSGAKRVVLWRVDMHAGLVRAVAAAGGVVPPAHIIHGSPLTWIAREHVSSRLEPAPTWASTRRVIGIPVLEETPQHALTFELDDEVDVNPGQFDALGIYTGALLGVMQDHYILAAYQSRNERLLEVLRTLPNVSSADDIAYHLVSAATRITGGTGAAITVWDANSGVVMFCDGGGPWAGAVVDTSLTALAARAHVTIAREGTALNAMKIVASGERFSPTPEAAAAVPLIQITRGELVGVLTVWSNTRIPETAISSLEMIAPYAANQLIHSRELGTMRNLAERDALTGLHNRRSFDEYLGAEVARFERYARPFALLMLDIDHFKAINDTHGHDIGDQAIKRVADLVASSLRDVDIAARYGGEEFAVILPETNLRRAVEVAERIRERVEATSTPQMRLTISAGVAAAPESSGDGKDLVRKADAALYASKNAGRNRVSEAIKR
jgi:diguanylate cyclase (GGDEF)-like protein